ncbi:MAG: HD domain-containing protein [Candidatus Eisenbacteria bacterium]|nr:HD domain-containing protein [Candidatus Eisenbacteria bacterium]
MDVSPADFARFRAQLPRGAVEIMRRIREAGGEAYLVGGCLRDLLLGRPVTDWDIATSLTPDQLHPLFRRVVSVGIRFGTLIIPRRDAAYEVTTFRTEGAYRDGRHPDEVAYTRDLRKDLERRDFTINAMAWDVASDTLVDPFEGLADLAAGRIRAVGDPRARFREDALRLMRAIRQATQLRFRIAPATFAALQATADGLAAISAERIRDELTGLLLAPEPSRGLRLLEEADLLRIVLPELAATRGFAQNRFHSHDLFDHSLRALDAAPPGDLGLRLAILLHDIGKVETREARGDDYTFYAHQIVGARKARRILQRLRYPNELIQRVTHLIRHHMFYYETEWTDSAVRRFVRTVGSEHIPDLIAVRIADMAGNQRKRGDRTPLDELQQRIDEVIAKDTALSVRDLAIGGHDLMALGVPEGPRIGEILRALLERVLDDPEMNTREALLAAAREMQASG